MGRNLSPALRRELENLDKDADSRKSAMKALRSYVKDLDSKAIPMFLAQVSETKETGLTSGEYTISLYEVLARVHGTKIVPQIDNIMLTIIKTLTSSAGSFALHQACSKVVPAIARYGMDPATPVVKKREIIRLLCKPLSDSLLSSHENLSSGSALCLKALVDSDNWRFASSQMVNEVCQRVCIALEKPMNTNSHMGLVMSLAKHNGSVVEDYARLLVRSGVGILNTGVTEGNSQKRLSAIQMVNFLMRSLDYKCIISELSFVIEEFEKCQNDQMAYVKGAAFEAIQTAKRILNKKGSNQSESLDSFRDDDDDGFTAYSPFSVSFASCDGDSESRSMNRKLWSNVDVSLKDGLFSGEMGTPRSVIESSETQGGYEDEFSGFLLRSPKNSYSRSATSSPQRSPISGYSRSATPSPQRSRSYLNIDNKNLFTTPRKLVKSLQVSTDNYSENESIFNWSPNSDHNQNDLNNSFTNEDEHFNNTSESVSSTADIPFNGNNNNNSQLSSQQLAKTTVKLQAPPAVTHTVSIASALFVLMIAVFCFLWVRGFSECNNLVPT